MNTVMYCCAVRCAGEQSQSCTVVLMKSAVRCAGEHSHVLLCYG